MTEDSWFNTRSIEELHSEWQVKHEEISRLWRQQCKNHDEFQTVCMRIVHLRRDCECIMKAIIAKRKIGEGQA